MERSILLSFVCALLALRSNCTDRVVSPSGTYSTISSAIAASSDGDRVLVASGTYVENISITRTLSVVPLVEGARYTVSGVLSVAHGNAPMSVLICGMHADLISSSGGPGRLDLRIVDSWLHASNFLEGSVHVQLYRDSLPGGTAFASGELIGCFLGDDPDTGSFLVSLTSGSTLPDENLVVGNYLRFIPSFASSAYLVDIACSQPFHVQNNFLFTVPGSSRFLRVLSASSSFQAESSIVNNTFFRVTSANQTTITIEPNITVVVKNNAMINDIGGQINFYPGTPIRASNNLLAAPSWINTATGQPAIGSPLINAGDPDPRYLDLDLTTNDVGCYGGSNSRANFTTPMGGAVVGFMQAPRVVAQGESVNIQAVGFDR